MFVKLYVTIISALQVELTVNIPNWFKFHGKTSVLSFKKTWLMRATKSCHKVSAWPVKVLLKDTLRGTLSNTDATVACFFCTILNRVGYCSLSDYPTTCPLKILSDYHHLNEKSHSSGMYFNFHETRPKMRIPRFLFHLSNSLVL